jgi:hypothetical protein
MADKDPEGLLSLLRDSTSRATLEKYMLAHGVDPYTAKEAATRCEKAALKNGALSAAGLGLLTLFATAPVAGLGAPAGMMIGLTFGTGGTLLFSKQCKEVQDAALGTVRSE